MGPGARPRHSDYWYTAEHRVPAACRTHAGGSNKARCGKRTVAQVRCEPGGVRIDGRYRGASEVILTIQIIVLLVLASTFALWVRYFPYPSPLIRRWLPPGKRWPEMQIRGWLAGGRFQTSFLQFFYRDPERHPLDGRSLVAPADGLITSTDSKNGVRYVVIALSFWDVHVQRSPAAGVVVGVDPSGDTFMDGEGREFAFLRAKCCPVQQRIVLRTAAGELAVRLITSLAARRIETWVKPGDTVDRGQRIGRILLGSTVVLELPEPFPAIARAGDRVRAGESPIAEVPPVS